ncbi:MAG: single-stranded-DNA-specific exonuclease RecJ [Planctomycetes bacterium]|nr:single-stranded-DNA-specific exonuclease RecJ [Planctomycetota bacterium]NOG55093.1 single-stranded-DNA-specific exonuclease RecJ [Planctomycetota bacterium]
MHDPLPSEGLTARWRCLNTDRPRTGPDSASLVSRILTARGLTDPQAIEHYLSVSLRDLPDAALLPAGEQAAGRLVEAVRNHERIVIYGDYDVDGITATATLYHAIKTADPDANVLPYVPHRLSEGYGLNVEAIAELATAHNADLIISVDCGITGFDAAQEAARHGCDLIITDHHNPPAAGEPLPPALAIVHPGLPDSAYPYPHLCGAGVAFKLAWLFALRWCGSERVSEPFRKFLTECLALTALGTIADVVPLTGENRILAYHGLRMMRHTRFTGLNALIHAAGLDDEARIDTVAVGFRLAPRLNACGRMGHARDAVHLLTQVTDLQEAARIAVELNRLNDDRRNTEQHILEQARAMAIEHGMTSDHNRIIVLAHEDWHRGVVGIVCSRLVDEFHRPTILLQKEDGIYSGSARSIPGYSIHAGLCAVDEHLDRYGGHDMAAGVAVKPEQFDSFVQAITAHANANLEPDALCAEVEIDCEAMIHELDLATVQSILDLGPFGQENPRPVIALRDLVLYSPPKRMGANGKHLSLTVRPAGTMTSAAGRSGSAAGPRLLRMVGWGWGHAAERLAQGSTLAAAAVTVSLNHWQGNTTVQGEIQDLALE